MPWIAPIASAVIGAAANYFGGRKSAKDANKAYQSMFGGTGYNMNPWIFSALGQHLPGANNPLSRQFVNKNSGFYQDLLKLVNGQDISPYLLNQPVNQINQGYNQNLAKFQSLVGRNNAGGGLTNAYGLANLAGRNNALASLYNNYGQWREQQRRNDIWNILGQVGGAQDRAAGRASQMAQYYQQPMNALTGIGNATTSGLAAYGALGNSTPTYNAITTPPRSPSFNPNVAYQ